MDFDNILFHENSPRDGTINDLEDALQKKSDSYLKLKKKIIATSSILTSYRETKDECDGLRSSIVELSNKNDNLTKLYEESLRVQMSLKQDAEILKALYDKTLLQYNDAIEQDKGKAATIKQLKDLTHELRNQLEGKTLENVMVKSQFKKELENCKKDLKSSINRHRLVVKSLIRKLKKIKRAKQIENEPKYIETINIKDIVNSPSSADTGKGSSVCTSDDETSFSITASPNLDDCSLFNNAEDTNLLFMEQIDDGEEMKRCYTSVATSPIRDTVCSQSNQYCVNCRDKISPRSILREHTTNIDEEVKHILNEMTRSVKPISPFPSDNIVTDTAVRINTVMSPIHTSRKYSSIKKRKILTSKTLGNIFKRVAHKEIKNILNQILRKRVVSCSINSKGKKYNLNSQLLSESYLLERINRRNIGKKTCDDSVSKLSKINFLKTRAGKQLQKTGSNQCHKEKETKIVNQTSEKVAKSPKDVENERKIKEAKKILLKYSSGKTTNKEKSYIKLRVGSKIKNIKMQNTNKQVLQFHLDKVQRNQLSQDKVSSKDGDERPQCDTKIRKSVRKRSLIEEEEKPNKKRNGHSEKQQECIYSGKSVEDTISIENNYCDKTNYISQIQNEEYILDNVTSSSAGCFPVFKFFVADCLLNMKKKHFVTHVIPQDLCTRFEVFLNSNFTVENMEEFICTLNVESEEKIAYCIVEFVCSPNRYTDTTYEHYPLLPMTRSHQAVLVLINKMLSANPPRPNVMELVMKGIEYKIFQLNKTPQVRSLQNMTPLYVALCRINKQKDRLKLFCLDALYCLSYSAIPIVFLVLQCWPALFPLSKFYSANDPLFVTMVHYLLTNFSDDIQFNCKNLQQLLLNKYGYKTGQYTDTQILELLVETIKSNDTWRDKALMSAFLLLGKRTGVEWCHNNIIVKSLLPLIDDPETNSFTKCMAIRLIGPLTRPFPDSKTLQCGILQKKITNMFGKSNNPCIDEAILTSVHFFKKKDNAFIQKLMQWRPTYQISQEIKKALEAIIQTKTKTFWLYTLRKNS